MSKKSEELIKILSIKQDSLIDICFGSSTIEYWYDKIQSCIDEIREHTKTGDDYKLKISLSKSFDLISELDLEF